MVKTKRLTLIALIPILFLGFLLPVTASRLATNHDKQAQEQKSVGAWMPYWDKDNVFKSYTRGKKLLNEISPYWYVLLPNGQLRPTEKFDVSFITEAKKAGVKIVPMVSNGYNGAMVSMIIRNPVAKKRHINELVNKVVKRNLDGIELDYEGLLAQDRAHYASFVKALADQLHKHKKILSVTLQAKTTEPGRASGSKAQDWEKLGTYADTLKIMAYDYHWKTSPPGAIAPINWVDGVAKHAVETIPINKIILGIGTYGYDWRSGRARPITLPQAKALAKKTNKRVLRDPKSKELYLRLQPGPPQIWLQDSGSLRLKLKIVKKYDLGGVFFWRLGNEQISYWTITQEELR